jgi:hypothetical protein
MLLKEMVSLFFNPNDAWNSLKEKNYSIAEVYLKHVIWVSLIPVVALYFGVTVNGWSLVGQTNHLTTESALPLAVMFYFSLLIGMAILGYCVKWMEKTFGANSSLAKCILFSSMAATPMYLGGLIGLFPNVWTVVGVLLGALGVTVYFLYSGVSKFMDIPPERGFIYASSILTVGLCMLVGLMITTIIVWSFGIEPILR